MSIDAYPLCWPQGWPRHSGSRDSGQFKGTAAKVQRELILEIDRLVLGRESRSYTLNDGAMVVVSTDIPLRKSDGMPYANSREPQDPGVAVYFHRNGRQQCFACDKYDRAWKNMRAIQKTIEAMRGIERWGSSDMLDRAFTGFETLPAPGKRKWWDVLGLNGSESKDTIRARYRELAKLHHPDNGGDAGLMAEINEAYREAMP